MDGESLTGARLAVCEDAAVVAHQALVYDPLADLLEDLDLRGLLAGHIVECKLVVVADLADSRVGVGSRDAPTIRLHCKRALEYFRKLLALLRVEWLCCVSLVRGCQGAHADDYLHVVHVVAGCLAAICLHGLCLSARRIGNLTYLSDFLLTCANVLNKL